MSKRKNKLSFHLFVLLDIYLFVPRSTYIRLVVATSLKCSIDKAKETYNDWLD